MKRKSQIASKQIYMNLQKNDRNSNLFVGTSIESELLLSQLSSGKVSQNKAG